MNTPATLSSTAAPTVTPAFQRVQQQTDHDCAFACIATIANKPLAEVVKVAIDKFKHPVHGPYWITEELIAKLFTHFGYVATVYKEVLNGLSDLPDVAIAMVDYDADTEIGRHVVFVRDKTHPKQPVEYIIDPAYWIDASLHIRNDFKALAPAWYIGVHPMKSSAFQTKK